jgi:hypothetical protein
MIDARKLRLVRPIFDSTTVVSFYSKDSYYTNGIKEQWRLVYYKFLGKLPKPWYF